VEVNYIFSGDRSRHHFNHIPPKVLGGRTVAPVCNHYNSNKGSKCLKSWFRYVIENHPEHCGLILNHNNRKRNRDAKVVRAVRYE
jgi:hypothetical protein